MTENDRDPTGRSYFVWDNHVCPPMDVDALPSHLTQLERLQRAGVQMVSLNVGYGEMSLSEHLTVLSAVRAWLLDRPDQYQIVSEVADIDEAAQAGRLAVAFDVEGVRPLDGSETTLEDFYSLGVRWMLLAYNRNNWAASGIHDDDQGLTPEGRQLIRRMQSIGMVVCLSHTSERTCEAAFDTAQAPLVFSHSNPFGIEAHPRNISDALIKRCAETGGVIGINGLELFIGKGRTNAAGFADHLTYVADLVGPEHCALGTDYVFDLDGLNQEKASMASSFPAGCGYEADTVCTAPEFLRELPGELSSRGWHENEIRDALGGNWLRIAEVCWR